MSEWIEVIGKVGFPVAMCLYLLWQQKKTNDATNKRVDALDEFVKNDLKDIAENSTKVIAENSEVLIRNTKALEKCTIELAKKEVA